MKKICKLDEVIKTYKGESIKDENNEPVLIKNVLINVIAGSKQDSGRDSMIMHLKIAPKILNGEKEVSDIEDYEHTLVKKAIESSQVSGLVKARLLDAIGEKLD